MIAGQMILDSLTSNGYVNFTRAVTWTPDGAGGYTVTDLGFLPGGRTSMARGINEHGRVIGQADVGLNTPMRAFAWDPREGMQSLASTASEAYAINGSGQVVGKLTGAVRWSVSWTPRAPGGLVATPASAARINLAWADSSSDETSFQLDRRQRSAAGSWGAYSNVQTLGANVTTAADSGLAGGVTYQYRIRACRSSCSVYSESTEATTIAPPMAPTAVGAVVASPTSVQVSWSDVSGNETHFQIARRLRSTSGVWSVYTNLPDVPANATSASDAGLLTGRTYQYRVRSCNALGCSAWVLGAAVTIEVIPVAPTVPVGTIVTPTRIQVRWADQSNNETRFELARRIRNADGSWASYVSLPNPPANATGAADTTVQTTQVYQYRLRSCNAVGCSAWMLSASVLLPPPTDLSTTVASATRINLHWEDRSSNETRFEVARRVRNGDGSWSSYTWLPNLGANVEALADTTLTPATTYQYRVRACSESGCSAWLTGFSVTTRAS